MSSNFNLTGSSRTEQRPVILFHNGAQTQRELWQRHCSVCDSGGVSSEMAKYNLNAMVILE